MDPYRIQRELLLKNIILKLCKEEHSKDVRTAVETLIKLYRNILQNPEKEEYRKLKLSNASFINKVWKFHNAQKFMLQGGWEIVNNEVVFWNNGILNVALNVLLDNRNITPQQCEWLEVNKHKGKSAEQLREENLKREAETQRDKELAEFLKDKKEREMLASSIKAEHEADRTRRRFIKPEVGTSLKKGAGICTLHSLNAPK